MVGVPLPIIAGVHVLIFSGVYAAVGDWTWGSAGGVIGMLWVPAWALIRVLAWPEAAGPAKIFTREADCIKGFYNSFLVDAIGGGGMSKVTIMD